MKIDVICMVIFKSFEIKTIQASAFILYALESEEFGLQPHLVLQ